MLARKAEREKETKLLNNKTEDLRGDSSGRGGNTHKSWQIPGSSTEQGQQGREPWEILANRSSRK